ncbi:unnamed protein product, partial [Phaeothamnion confervicola]
AILALQSGDAAVQCRRWGQLEEEDDVVEALRADLCDEVVADVLPGAGQHTAVESGGEEEKFDAEQVAGDEGEAGCAAACGATDRQFDQPPPFSGDLAAAWELMAETAARTGYEDASWALRKTKLAFMTAYGRRDTKQIVIGDYFFRHDAGGSSSGCYTIESFKQAIWGS